MNKSKIVLLLAIVTIVFFISNVHGGEEDKTSLSDILESRIIRDAQRKGIKKRKGNISQRKQKGGKRKQSIKRKGKGKKINRKLNKRKGKKGKQKKPSKACFKKAVGDLNKLSSFVANFIKQMKRVEKQTKVAGNKNEKSGIFPDVAALLVNLGGGNVSSLSVSKSCQ